MVGSNATATIVEASTIGVETSYHFILAGDIGGTNSRFALYERIGSRYDTPVFVREYRNEDHYCSNLDVDDDQTTTNTQRFVQTILDPFLKEFWESGVVVQENLGFTVDTDVVTIVCCLGVAGPVDISRDNGIVTTSQRDYLIGLNGKDIVEECRTNGDAPLLLSCLKACVIINDFVAQGYGCLSLTTTAPGELKQLIVSNSNSNINSNSNSNNCSNNSATGPKFCVGAGTGFGSCYMAPTTTTIHNDCDSSELTEYIVFPSEYGQSDWAPNPAVALPMISGIERNNEQFYNEKDNDQARLWKYLAERKMREKGFATTATNTATESSTDLHIAIEEVVSGVGLATTYECLCSLIPEKVNQSVRELFESEGDFRGRVVGEHASDCEICKRAVETVLRAYGSIVGSCSMAFLPKGGLYVTGGLLRNLLGNNLAVDDGAKERNGSSGGDEASLSSQLLALFTKAYRAKGAASFLLDQIPLYLVLAKDTGLRGAAVRAEMEFKKYNAVTPTRKK